jgi:capsular polysaccharide biosynthesis protein
MDERELSISQERYEDEIDLSELLGILIRNWKTVIGVTFIISIISLGGALYVRSKTYDKNAVDFILRSKADNFFINKASLTMETFRLEDVLVKNEIVEEFYEIEELNQVFKNKNLESSTIYDKRKFLKEIIELDKVEEEIDKKKNFKNYQLSVSTEAGEDLNKKIIQKYFEIIERERELQIQNGISRDYDLVNKKVEFYDNELGNIEEQIRNAIAKEPSAVLANEGIIGVISTKYPRLFEKKNQVQELYRKYTNQLIGLEGLREDEGVKKQVEVLSSVYKVRNKSKALMILAVGTVLGLFMGIFAAFVKEFIKGIDFKKIT